MMGKEHKMIGVAVGTSLLLYGVFNDMAWLTPAVMISPFAAMFPDIDHNSTKLGRTRKAIMNAIKSVILVAIAVIVAFLVFSLITGELVTKVQLMLGILVLMTVIVVLAVSGKMQSVLGFYTKHRGIMHTLAVPTLLGWLSITLSEGLLKGLAVGAMAGYLSHLVADMFNPDGVPILWPITTKPIRVAKFKASSGGAKVVAYILSFIVIGVGLFTSYMNG